MITWQCSYESFEAVSQIQLNKTVFAFETTKLCSLSLIQPSQSIHPSIHPSIHTSASVTPFKSIPHFDHVIVKTLFIFVIRTSTYSLIITTDVVNSNEPCGQIISSVNIFSVAAFSSISAYITYIWCHIEILHIYRQHLCPPRDPSQRSAKHTSHVIKALFSPQQHLTVFFSGPTPRVE